MQTLQIRLPEMILEQVDELVKKGFYSSRSDFIKEAVRKYVSEFNFAGVLPYIVGPFTKEEINMLKTEPNESLFVSNEELKDIKKIVKEIKL